MEQPIIQIKNVTKTFQTRENRVEALKNINLEINKGDIYGIIGMSAPEKHAGTLPELPGEAHGGNGSDRRAGSVGLYR